jgi:hypothetical protein
MEEGDAIEFYDEVVGEQTGPHTPDETKEFVLEARNKRELTVTLEPVDRKAIIDELNNLPDEMLDMFSEADDPEEAQEEAEATDALGGLSGDAIHSFENICAAGMNHGKLTQHHFDDMVEELSLEVLFEMGSNVIEMSLEDDGNISGFREPGSDKSS